MGLRDPATGQWRTIEDTDGFIVDWPAGEIAHVPDELERYEASFFVRYPNSTAERLAYVVLYANDPTRNEGYVFLPGPGDERYQLNTRAILRGGEGKWYRASSAWQATVVPLITAHPGP